MKTKVLYIYGYGGSSLSATRWKLREFLPMDLYDVLCVDYPQENCGSAIKSLTETIESENVDIIVGSSLGAFITMCLDIDKPKIIVNPCLYPSQELPVLHARPRKMAPTAKMVSSYEPYESTIFQNITNNSFCFMAEEDELFGSKYRPEMESHYPVTTIPGGHRISENDEAIKIITGKIRDLTA